MQLSLFLEDKLESTNKKPWIAFFSQTGSEIAEIAHHTGRWPDRIITNDRPDHLRTIDERIVEQGFHTFSNKPNLEEYKDLLEYFPEAIITLHGWLSCLLYTSDAADE